MKPVWQAEGTEIRTWRLGLVCPHIDVLIMLFVLGGVEVGIGRNAKAIVVGLVCVAVLVSSILWQGYRTAGAANAILAFQVTLPEIAKDGLSIPSASPTAASGSSPTASPVPSTPSPSAAPVSPTATPTPSATATTTATPTSTPSPTSTPTPPPLARRLGVQLGPGAAANVNLLNGTGAKLTRVTLSWSEVERSYTDPPTYDLGRLDTLLVALGAAGISPIVEVRSAPSWASSRECGPTYTADGRAGFGRLLRSLAQRYNGPPYNVKNWEMFNEPDSMLPTMAIPGGLGCWALAPAEYADILQMASNSIKGVDPDAKIWFGGMAHEGLPNFDNDFLDKVLASGGGPYFDIANVHYYSSQNDGTFQWYQYGGAIQDIAGKVGEIRLRLARNGVSKPVAVTEMSWTSSPLDAPDLAEKQARYVAKVLARGANIVVDLYAMSWFTLTDYAGTDYPYGLADITANQDLHTRRSKSPPPSLVVPHYFGRWIRDKLAGVPGWRDTFMLSTGRSVGCFGQGRQTTQTVRPNCQYGFQPGQRWPLISLVSQSV